MPRYAPVDSRARFAEAELDVLELWRSRDVFARSVEQRRGGPEYVFLDGPPTANARPGIHHVLARAYKDLFPRYRAMCGYHVLRKAGWDTHGLPVELEIEKKLGISGKRQIEEYGVDRFNALCRASVDDYIDEWERLTERMGFWIDMQRPYRTYDSAYIESVWWSLKQLFDKGLLYQGYRVAPYCPRCQTALSSHELALGYREGTVDPSVYVRFRLSDGDGAESLLAWTTTPWTLPGNVAVAVHPDATYVRVAQNDEVLILAKSRLAVLTGDHEIIEEFPGRALVGRTYTPLYTELAPAPEDGDAFVVLAAPDLVSMEDGTGIVHTAAAYGDADLRLCQEHGVAVRHVVGLDGRFLEGTRYAHQFVKDADPRIIDDLRESGALYLAETVEHTYPFCWRCETPLIYYALTSWFIRTTSHRQDLIDNNNEVAWQPAHIREGRMGNWLENNVDWNISRTRYWGTPLPIWQCLDCGHQQCAGSVRELGLVLERDLHRPHIDDVTMRCRRCDGLARRVPEVIDCWYDSGAMPFAQWHYPFENRELVDARRPADFICEAIDQTRGWFYSLLAEATMLFDEPAYRNCVCLGLVVDEKGRKYSKSRGIVVEPLEVFDRFGADATRWYFYSAVSAGSEYRFGERQVEDVVRRFLLTLWNTYSFFVSYAEIDGFDPAAAEAPPFMERPVLDRWCLSRLGQTVDTVRTSLDRYDATDACRAIEHFVEDLSKWYVRRSRRRFWKSGAGDDADKRSAYATLHTALETVARLCAPFMPFLSERIWRNLSGFDGDAAATDAACDSVHLTDFPVAEAEWEDFELVTEMSRLRRLVEDGLSRREQARIKVRQPLAAAIIHGERLSPELEAIFADELNVKSVRYAGRTEQFETVELDTEITEELRLEGIARDLSRKVNELRKQAGLALDDRIVLRLDADGGIARAVAAHRDYLQGETLTRELVLERGDALATWEGELGGERCWLGVTR